MNDIFSFNMKKFVTWMIVLTALSFAGCSASETSEDQESASDSLLSPYEQEQYVPINEETHLAHYSEWYPYVLIDFFGEGYEKANNHDFMDSGNQYIHMYWYSELTDILYAYSQCINQNLLSDGWVVESITPIGSGYYNALLHQKENEVRADLLFNPTEGEYKVLYVTCENGEHTSYNGVSYMSQYEWKPYIWEETSAAVDNPFSEIYESSIDTAIDAAVTAYEQEMEYVGSWKVQEIYAYSSLTNCLLASEDGVVWFCLDVYTNEYAAETFQGL